MKILLLVGTGGFIGSIGRYLMAGFVQSKFFSAFPFGTLGVNILGCFVIGLVFGLSEKINMNTEWRVFFAAGICGGFTTFSAFSNETVGLLRAGHLLYGLYYVTASVVLGLLATVLGYASMKII